MSTLSKDPVNNAQQIPDDRIYHRMIEHVEDYAILMMDKNGIIQNWNRGAEKIKGYHADEIIGQNFRVFYLPEDRKAKLPERLIKAAAKKGRATHEGWRLRKDQSGFWGSITITALRDEAGELIGFTKVTRDLTERKRMNEQIQHAIWEAQEKERTELSEILHDNVSQMLAAGKISLEIAARQCTSEHLTSVQKYIMLALDEIKKMSHRLNPSAELSRSLPEAILMLIDDMNMLDKTRFDFFEEGDAVNADPAIDKMLFRITQELVSNILKYSNAPEATLRLVWQPASVTLTIADNGIGFNLKEIKKGLGLANLEPRLALYNGAAVITTGAGKGCSIKITVPLMKVQN